MHLAGCARAAPGEERGGGTMQTNNPLLDDLARLATGALGTLTGVRTEVESRVRDQFERVLSRMDLVTREEFEAAREMAAKARSEQEVLLQRIAELEERLKRLEGGAARAAKRTAPPNVEPPNVEPPNVEQPNVAPPNVEAVGDEPG
jgi:BMFP domain-containing protein YqiC